MYIREKTRFRQDLVIKKEQKSNSPDEYYLIQDSASGESFEFGKEEFFLCSSLDGKSSTEVIINNFQKQFGFSISSEDCEAFFQQITELGLVEFVIDEQRDSSVVPLENIPDSLTKKKIKVENQLESNLENKIDKPAFNQVTPKHQVLPKTSQENSKGLSLGNPEKLFQVLASLFQPWSLFFKLSTWALIPLVVIASFTWMKNQFIIQQNLALTSQPTSFLFGLILHILIINFFTQLIRSIVASVYGLKVTDYGMRLRWGIIPIVYFQNLGLNELNRRQQLWLYGSTLIFRLYIFVLGTFVWYSHSGTASILTTWGIIFANLGLLSFFHGALPIRPTAPGAKLLCLYLGKPANYSQKLIKRTFKSIRLLITNPTKRAFISTQDLIIILVGLVVAILFALVIIRIMLRLTTGIAESIPPLLGRSTSYIIFGLVFLLFSQSLISKISKLGAKKKKNNNDKKQLKVEEFSDSVKEEKIKATNFKLVIGKDGVPILKTKPWWQKIVNLKTVVLAALVIISLIDFPYNPGGEITLLPPQKQQIQAPISGQISQVFFNGGDGQLIKAGTVVAQMVSSEIKTEILTLKEQIQRQEATIEKQSANLNKLLSLPRPEEVGVAQAQVEVATQEAAIAQRQLEVTQQEIPVAQQELATAQINAKYSAREVERLEILYQEGAFALQRVEEARKEAQTDLIAIEQMHSNIVIKQKNVAQAQQTLLARQQEISQAQAHLQLVLSGAPPEEIEGARQEVAGAQAELRRLQQQLNHAQVKEQGTQLIMPFDGYLVDAYLQQKLGSYLNLGDTFAAVQDNSNLLVEIEIPEYDAGEIPVGAPAQVKLVAYPNDKIVGKVVAIEPATSEELYGIVFKVLVEVEGYQRQLRPGMSGYGKIDVGEKPLVVLLTRPLARFLQIEFWSWLP